MTLAAPHAVLVRLIGAQPELARAICTFNQNPADYIDESRRNDFFASRIDDALWDCARSRRHLSRHIIECLGVEPCLDMQSTAWPVALLDRARLDRLARHVAAALVGSRARRCVSRADVLAWRDWLAPDAHDFALTRAGLLPNISADASVQPAQSSALDVGRAWIVAASRRWHEAIARRFMLKLPTGSFSETGAVDGASAQRVVSSVLSIMEPRWCSSFATMRV